MQEVFIKAIDDRDAHLSKYLDLRFISSTSIFC